MRVIISLFCLVVCLEGGFGQSLLPDSFGKKLKSAGLEFIEPVEGKIKKIEAGNSEIFTADAVLRIKKERLEIQIKVDLLRNNTPIGRIPHLEAMKSATNIASNDEDSHIVIHQMHDNLLTKYAADWGAIYYFNPKSAISAYDHCKQVCFFKKGKAIVTVLYLFDDENVDMDRLGTLVHFAD